MGILYFGLISLVFPLLFHPRGHMLCKGLSSEVGRPLSMFLQRPLSYQIHVFFWKLANMNKMRSINEAFTFFQINWFKALIFQLVLRQYIGRHLIHRSTRMVYCIKKIKSKQNVPKHEKWIASPRTALFIVLCWTWRYLEEFKTYQIKQKSQWGVDGPHWIL